MNQTAETINRASETFNVSKHFRRVATNEII